jgi:hypothetical protein
MKIEASNVGARQAWERPTLYRLDAADAQMTTVGALNDGAANKS